MDRGTVRAGARRPDIRPESDPLPPLLPNSAGVRQPGVVGVVVPLDPGPPAPPAPTPPTGPRAPPPPPTDWAHGEAVKVGRGGAATGATDPWTLADSAGV